MSEPAKVLQLGSSSGLYGAERWILSLVKYLDASVVESHVAAIVDDDSGEAPLCVEAAKLNVATRTFFAQGRFNLSIVRKIRAYVRENEIDIIHSHGYKTDMLALLVSLGLPCKLVSTPHGWTENPDFKLRLYESLDRFLFPFFHKVVPLSDGLMESLSGFWARRSELMLIKNGVDIGEIEALDEPCDMIAGLKKDGYQIVGYIGRLVSGKGLDTLVKAMKGLKGQAVKLLVIGEGDQEQELRELAESIGVAEQIVFLGFRADRLAFLKGFDVFVLPSRSEGIPRCVMESMAAEVPVIASDIPGCRTLIDGQQTGLLFKMDDVKDLEEKLRILLADAEQRERLSSQAKKFLDENYSAKRMAREYEQLFIGMITSSPVREG